MIEWASRKARSRISDADVSVQVTTRFARFIFRNHCKRLFGKEDMIAVGVDGNRVYFKVGDTTLDRFKLAGYSSDSLAATLNGSDRVATYKRFDGNYTIKLADETGLFYIEKENPDEVRKD